MFALVVRVELSDGHEEAFDRLVSETLGRIEGEEPGTFASVVHAVEESPQSRILHELYNDYEAFETHEHNSHTQRFLTEREQHLRHDPLVWRLSTKAGLASARGDRDRRQLTEVVDP
jgi:quinol monooxygenase YgiN